MKVHVTTYTLNESMMVGLSSQVTRHVVSLESSESDQSYCSIPEVLSNMPPINSLIKVTKVVVSYHPLALL